MIGRASLSVFCLYCFAVIQAWGNTSVNNEEANGRIHFAQDVATAIPNKYIVVFSQETTDDDIDRIFTLSERLGNLTNFATATRLVKRLNTFGSAIRAATISIADDSELFTRSFAWGSTRLGREHEVLGSIIQSPLVAYIEQDQVVSIQTQQANPPSWGLDRIDQESGLDGIYTYEQTGKGVTAYVIDSGIRFTHSDFGGRATCGINLVATESCEDANGHGTHVAGIIGGQIYGVAKQVNLVAVKVFDHTGTGSASDTVNAIDWVSQQLANATGPIVVNMSLGSFISFSVNDAIANAFKMGIFFAVAAGNGSRSACISSPASSQYAMTVASSNINDQMSDYSNFGLCVDIIAPGENITSAWNGNDSDSATISGTSMSSPHVAGVAALNLELKPVATPEELKNWILQDAVQGAIANSGSTTPNLLLQTRTLALEQTLTPTQSPIVKSTQRTTNYPTQQLTQAQTQSPIVESTAIPTSYPTPQLTVQTSTRIVSLRPTNIHTTAMPSNQRTMPATAMQSVAPSSAPSGAASRKVKTPVPSLKQLATSSPNPGVNSGLVSSDSRCSVTWIALGCAAWSTWQAF